MFVQLGKQHNFDRALELFLELQMGNMDPTRIVVSAFLAACVENSKPRPARQLIEVSSSLTSIALAHVSIDCKYLIRKDDSCVCHIDGSLPSSAVDPESPAPVKARARNCKMFKFYNVSHANGAYRRWCG